MNTKDLRNLKIKDIMIRTSTHLLTWQHLSDALQCFVELKVSALPVFDKFSNAVGVITQQKVIEALAEKQDFSIKVEDLMDPIITLVKENDLVTDSYQEKCVLYTVMNKSKELIGLVTKEMLMAFFVGTYKNKIKELEAIFESSLLGICAIDSSGIITSFNPAAARMSGVKREYAIGAFLSKVVVPTGLLEVVRTGKPQHSVEYVVGKKKYMSNRTPLIKNGKVVGAVGFFQEISEIEKIYKKFNNVEALNNEMTTLINSSYDTIVICNPNGQIIQANEAALHLFLMETDQITGVNISQIFGYKTSIDELINEVHKMKKSSTIVEFYRNEQFIINANPVLNDKGDVWRITLNIRDIKYFEKVKESIDNHRSNQNDIARAHLPTQYNLINGMIVESAEMNDVVDKVKRIAKVESTVLIRGESGTGKEIIAELVHKFSNRKNGPLIKINCGAIPENLLESELFGYAPGSFTGANKNGKKGLFELAHTGTIFLDEIGEMPISLQVKLLRVLQEREVQRIGEGVSRIVDVRIIAATNRNLEELVKSQQFREDLYFRLNVIPVIIPPLRDRKEEILPLISYFTNKFSEMYEIKKEYSVKALSLLLNYEWQGNVRELINIVERLVVTIKGPIIKDTDVLENINSESENEKNIDVYENSIIPIKKAVEEVERKVIANALRKYKNTYEVAKVLEVNQSTIVRKIKKLGIEKSFS